MNTDSNIMDNLNAHAGQSQEARIDSAQAFMHMMRGAGNRGVNFTKKADPVVVDVGQELPDSFYLVWNPAGATPPSYRHHSHASAVKEAERLAFENPGQQFVVLLATDVRFVDPMIRVSLGSMPF